MGRRKNNQLGQWLATHAGSIRSVGNFYRCVDECRCGGRLFEYPQGNHCVAARPFLNRFFVSLLVRCSRCAYRWASRRRSVYCSEALVASVVLRPSSSSKSSHGRRLYRELMCQDTSPTSTGSIISPHPLKMTYLAGVVSVISPFAIPMPE